MQFTTKDVNDSAVARRGEQAIQIDIDKFIDTINDRDAALERMEIATKLQKYKDLPEVIAAREKIDSEELLNKNK